jgi:hypothetical protein
MGSVFEINRKRVFTITEARQILPVVRRATEEANLRIRGLLSKLESVKGRDLAKAKELEDQIDVHVSEWQTKITKLGAESKGFWLVDFDCGTGYYCWKFPESNLEHFHGYTEGYKARVKVQGSNVEEKVDAVQRLGEEIAPAQMSPEL